MGPSFALTLPNGMTWDACVSEHQAKFSKQIVGAKKEAEQAATDIVQCRSVPNEEVQTVTTDGRFEPKSNGSDPHQGSPVENTLRVNRQQDSAVHLNVKSVAGGAGGATAASSAAAADTQATADILATADGWAPEDFWGPARRGAHG